MNLISDEVDGLCDRVGSYPVRVALKALKRLIDSRCEELQSALPEALSAEIAKRLAAENLAECYRGKLRESNEVLDAEVRKRHELERELERELAELRAQKPTDLKPFDPPEPYATQLRDAGATWEWTGVVFCPWVLTFADGTDCRYSNPPAPGWEYVVISARSHDNRPKPEKTFDERLADLGAVMRPSGYHSRHYCVVAANREVLMRCFCNEHRAQSESDALDFAARNQAEVPQ